jgi:ferritin-like protein
MTLPGAEMSSEDLHVPREKLSKRTLNQHYAITSLIEEMEAVDWYRQRADDCDDPELKKILLHNAREELEHAAMVLEWLRRSDPETDEQLREYLFKEGSITGHEEEATGK